MNAPQAYEVAQHMPEFKPAFQHTSERWTSLAFAQVNEFRIEAEAMEGYEVANRGRNSPTRDSQRLF